jgi:tRNA(His) guanylyltransferase
VIGDTPSDAIPLIFYPGGKLDSAIFCRLSKLASVLASMATAQFNALVPSLLTENRDQLALSDGRVWGMPSEQEAVNILLWRELDATRTSLQMAAQARDSHTQGHQHNTAAMQAMLGQQGSPGRTTLRGLHGAATCSGA